MVGQIRDEDRARENALKTKKARRPIAMGVGVGRPAGSSPEWSHPYVLHAHRRVGNSEILVPWVRASHRQRRRECRTSNGHRVHDTKAIPTSETILFMGDINVGPGGGERYEEDFPESCAVFTDLCVYRTRGRWALHRVLPPLSMRVSACVPSIRSARRASSSEYWLAGLPSISTIMCPRRRPAN